MRVGSAKSGRDPQEHVDRARRDAPDPRALVVRPAHRLRSDDQVGPLGEERKRALVEADVAEIDLVADDHAPARLQDSALERASIIRLVLVEPAHPRVALRHLAEHFLGGVARAVFGEDDLEIPSERLQLAGQILDRLPDDRGLVVDGDDDRHLRRGHAVSALATSRPETIASSIELYSHLP